MYDDNLTMCPYCGHVDGEKAEQEIHMDPGTYLYDRYIVGNVIGYGGFGVTYVGWDAKLEQKVAIKEYLPSEYSTRMPGQSRVTVFGGNKADHYKTGMSKFVDEAKRLAKCTNTDGIVKIFDAFEENDTAYIIMEYLEGETLADRLKREKTIPEDEAVKMMLPVMHSLEIVHKEGIIHRDIAPDNIFLTKDGSVKLIDFGASRYANTSQSRSLTVIIKPGYSPEEQYRSRGDQGPHTDVYAVAATLYKMITGKTPPDALERRAFFENKKKDILDPIVKYDKDISKNRENAILNAVNIRIEDRTPDMATFIEQLTSTQPVKRISGKISKIDVLRWPLWAKIGVPAAAMAVVALILLLANGVIGYKSNLKEVTEIPDGMVRVPSVIKVSRDEAEEKLKEANLVLYHDGESYLESPDIPAYYVLSQGTSAGMLVKENERIYVVLSKGMDTKKVENLVGKTQEEAEKWLDENGFEVEIEPVYHDTIPAGYVATQSIPENTVCVVGETVILGISQGRSPDSEVQVQTVEVPSFKGKTYDEAQEMAKELGLIILPIYQYSDEPKNKVLSQSIAGGTLIENTQVIELTISDGPKMIEIDFYGDKTLDEVKALIGDDLVIKIKKVKRNGSYKVGQILDQSLAVDSQVKVGSEITLYIWDGVESFKIANVENKSKDEAIKILKNQNLNVVPTNDYSSSVPEGYVISQTPSAGSSVSEGDTVTIVISSGEELFEVTNVVGLDKSEAASKLSKFTVKYTEVYSNTAAVGEVISQSPAAGVKLVKDSVITLNVSRGKQYVTVTCYPEDGSSNTSTIKVAVGEKYSNLKDPTRSGYTFAGWYTSKTGGSRVYSTSTVTDTSNHSLYARWKANTYYIKFNGNGATGGSTATVTATYGETVKLTSNGYYKDYYKFSGWSLKSDGTGTIYANSGSVKNLKAENGATITLYAKWEAKDKIWASAGAVPSDAKICLYRYKKTTTDSNTTGICPDGFKQTSKVEIVGQLGELIETGFYQYLDVDEYRSKYAIYGELGLKDMDLDKRPTASADEILVEYPGQHIGNAGDEYAYIFHWCSSSKSTIGAWYHAPYYDWHSNVVQNLSANNPFYATDDEDGITRTLIRNSSYCSHGRTYWFAIRMYQCNWEKYKKVYNYTYEKTETIDSETTLTSSGKVKYILEQVQYIPK